MKKYRIGLEISEKKLQLAVVATQKQGWRLIETFSLAATPDNRWKILQEIRHNIARSIRQTILSLPYNQVLVKEIRLDATLHPDEIYQYLQQQAMTLFGKPADHWYFDFEPLYFSTNISQQAYFRIAATPRANVVAAEKLCQGAGFHVRAVTIDVLALANLATTLQSYRPDQTQAILWVKTNELLFLVVKSGHLIFSKTTTYTSIQSIQEALTSLIHFFTGLYPNYILEKIFLINEHLSLSVESLAVESAALNKAIWQVPHAIQPQEFCSLGLAIYGY